MKNFKTHLTKPLKLLRFSMPFIGNIHSRVKFLNSEKNTPDEFLKFMKTLLVESILSKACGLLFIFSTSSRMLLYRFPEIFQKIEDRRLYNYEDCYEKPETASSEFCCSLNFELVTTGIFLNHNIVKHLIYTFEMKMLN